MGIFGSNSSPAGASGGGKAGSGIDITAMFRLLNMVSGTAQNTSDIGEGIACALEEVCAYTGWPIGHAYLRHESEEEGKEITAQSGKIWFLSPDINQADVSDFVEMSENTTFVPGQGMVGKVLAEQNPVTIEDVTVLQGFVRAEGAKRNNVQGCFSFPVIYKEKAEIILEFFSREKAVLDETTLEILKFVGNQLNAVLTARDHKAHIAKLAEDFESGVGQVVSMTEDSIFTLNESAQQLSESINDSKSNAQDGVDCSEETGRIVNEIAEGVSSVSGSISQITDQVQASNRLALSCRDKMEHADERSAILSDAADRVTTAISYITDFANKTNLLALNATIEAARAGEAGKGFAVVANEVKDLAAQTGKSASEIEEVVAEMVEATEQINTALREANDSVKEICDSSEQISGAMSEQRSVSETISGNMQRATASSSDVSQRLSMVTTSFDESSQASAYVALEADTISQMSNTLKESVDEFLERIREAS